MNSPPRGRAAITLAETVIALAVTAATSVVIAQCLVWCLRERARLASEQAALELAANVLEAGRAAPWDKLDDAWAKSQSAVPAASAALLPGGEVAVAVAPEKGAADIRRLTVEVRWQSVPGVPPNSVRLVGLLSGRSAKRPGGEP